MTRVVLDDGLGLELSNFGRLLKMRPGVGDEHRLVQRLASNLCFRQTDYVRDKKGNLVRRNALSAEENLKAMALRIKPHTNPWFYLSPRLCPLGQAAFGSAQAVKRDPPVSEEGIRSERTGGSDEVATDAANQHDVLGRFPGGRAGYEGRI